MIVYGVCDYIGFFALGIGFGLVFAGIFFLVGLTVSQCVKLIKSA